MTDIVYGILGIIGALLAIYGLNELIKWYSTRGNNDKHAD